MIDKLFIDLFNTCYYQNETNHDVIYKFFYNYQEFKNNINKNNYRPIFCLALRLNNYKLIDVLKDNLDIISIIKEHFDIKITNNIKSKKLLEILNLINIYDI